MIAVSLLISSMIGFAINLLRVSQDLGAFNLLRLYADSTIMVLLPPPILVPIVQSAGADPVHIGILMTTIATLGSMTPPVGGGDG